MRSVRTIIFEWGANHGDVAVHGHRPPESAVIQPASQLDLFAPPAAGPHEDVGCVHPAGTHDGCRPIESHILAKAEIVFTVQGSQDLWPAPGRARPFEQVRRAPALPADVRGGSAYQDRVTAERDYSECRSPLLPAGGTSVACLTQIPFERTNTYTRSLPDALVALPCALIAAVSPSTATWWPK